MWTYNIKGKQIEIEYDSGITDKNIITCVTIDSELLQNICLSNVILKGLDVIIDKKIYEVSNLIFDGIGILRQQGNYLLAFHLADHLFNYFGGVCREMKKDGRHLHCIKLWIIVCNMVWDWESKNNEKIHKGTPYHFMGQTLIEMGDIDSGFSFVFNAVEEDKRSNKEIGNPDGYKSAPAYMFVTSADNPRNSMYPLIVENIIKLQHYFDDYQKSLGGQITAIDFEDKFLHQPSLEEIAFFFVYNLRQLIKYEKMTRSEVLQNEFSKLKNLDLIFNLCLIVDKVLSKKYSQPAKKENMIGTNVFEYCKDKLSISEKNAKELIKNVDIKIDNDPDKVVPLLLRCNVKYKGQIIDKKMATMILVWHLRNYGGHNIKGQQTLITDFPEIVKHIMYALFLAIEAS